METAYSVVDMNCQESIPAMAALRLALSVGATHFANCMYGGMLGSRCMMKSMLCYE